MNNLTIIHHNIRSLNDKLTELKLFIEIHQPDIITLNESLQIKQNTKIPQYAAAARTPPPTFKPQQPPTPQQIADHLSSQRTNTNSIDTNIQLLKRKTSPTSSPETTPPPTPHPHDFSTSPTSVSLIAQHFENISRKSTPQLNTQSHSTPIPSNNNSLLKTPSPQKTQPASQHIHTTTQHSITLNTIPIKQQITSQNTITSKKHIPHLNTNNRLHIHTTRTIRITSQQHSQHNPTTRITHNANHRNQKQQSTHNHVTRKHKHITTRRTFHTSYKQKTTQATTINSQPPRKRHTTHTLRTFHF